MRIYTRSVEFLLGTMLVLCVVRLPIQSADCNLNGVADRDDVESGTSNDCNEDRIPDETPELVERPETSEPRGHPRQRGTSDHSRSFL